MGFLCTNKNIQKEVNQVDLFNQEESRNLGLSNIYNLNPEINFCSEIFLNPEFYLSGTSKLYSGYTSTLTGCTTGYTGIYNLDYTPEFSINYLLTGGTSYTGYTGSFCYKMYSDKFFNTLINGNLLKEGSEIINECIPFSSITSTTVTKQFLDGSLNKDWVQYLVRPYFIYKSVNCNKNTYYNTWDYNTQFNSFNNNTDWLITTIVNPPTPQLAPPSGQEIPIYTLISDKLFVNGLSTTRGSQAINNILNYFILSSIPANNEILLILNGIQLTQGYDFKLISQGFGLPPIVEIFNEIKSTDWLIASYITSTPTTLPIDFGSYFIDTILLDGFTSTTTPSYRTSGDNTLNYNPTTLNYEFFTSLPIDQANDIVLTINGIKLVEGSQYFKSTSSDARIIFDKNNTTFKIGDVISVLAVSKTSNSDNNDYGSLNSNQFTVQWSIQPTITNNKINGKFIVEAYNDDTSILTNQLYIDYNQNTSNYIAVFTNLSLNINYRFRVTFEVIYNSLLGNKITTCSYSEGYFNTTGSYINNVY
jgi:hypothetical protein